MIMPPDPPANPAPNGDEHQDHDDAGDGTRLDRLEQRIETIADMVNRLLPGSQDEAQQRTENRLDRPTDMQAAVRAELERRDKAAAEQAAAETAQQEQRSLREEVARLREQPPAPPVPRRTKILGWGE